MKVEFFHPEAPDVVVATASWRDGRASVDSGDDDVAQALWKVFRSTPVVVDDPAYRRQGTSGEVMIQPGTLAWFRAAAQVRAHEAGFASRLVPEVAEGGYDPAAQYRTFEESIERLGSP